MYNPGEILSVKWYLGIEHEGIYTDTGTVISASKRTGKVVEEDLQTFSGRRKIKNLGYPSDLPVEIVLNHARKKIGKRYNVLSDNCQHFASDCHGRKHSHQLRSLVISTISFAALAILTRGRIFRA